MKTNLYIGPLIERNGKFSYDTFSLADGLRVRFTIGASGMPDTINGRWLPKSDPARSWMSTSARLLRNSSGWSKPPAAPRKTRTKCNRAARNGASANTDTQNAKEPSYWRTR